MAKKPDMDALVDWIVESGMAKMEELSGFYDDDIAALERTNNVHLPRAYKEFLSSIGYSSSNVFYSVLFVYPGLETYRLLAYEMAEQCKIQLTPSDFVFLIDDTQFFYFDTKSGDDPEVYKYMEGDDAPKKVFDHFSDWLTDFVTVEGELERKYRSGRKRSPI